MKVCTKCNVFKNSTKFHKDKTKKDGLRSSCKSCQQDYNKKKADVIYLKELTPNFSYVQIEL